ncbi:MAG: hypothetical protein WDO71_22820 [Bacteroidota bacterium]
MTGDDLYSQGTADYKTGEAENLNKRVGKLYHFKFLFMKKLKTALAVVAAVAFIVAFSAFNFAHNDTKKATTKYFYYQVVSGAGEYQLAAIRTVYDHRGFSAGKSCQLPIR